MSITYDTTGISIQTLTEILDERENNLQSFLGADFIISGDSAIGNLQAADSDRELDIQELILYCFNQLDPDQAEGIVLDWICALNNITRYSAEKTTIPLTITGTPNVSKDIGEIIVIDNDTDEYFTNKTAFTVGIGGTVNVEFEATSFGDITASSSHSYSLKTASSGISSVAWNLSGSYLVGRYAETDTELRARRTYTIDLTATSTLASIRANVSDVNGVSYLNVYENDTNSTVDTIPAKAFEVVVLGGSNSDIAQAILEKKPAGIQAYGTTTEAITDENGNSFNIGFTRPTEIPVEFRITAKVSSTQSETWETNLKQTLLTKFEELYDVGSDIYVFDLYCVLNSIPEIINVTQFQVQKEIDSNSWSDSLIINKRELATLSISNIIITQNT